MRLRDSRPRVLLEWAMRLAALALLGWAALAALAPQDPPPARRDVAAADSTALREAAAASLAHVHARMDSAAAPEARDRLRAMAGAGTRVTWSGDVAPIAAAVEPVADPRGGARVLVASPRGALALRDAAGPIDSIASAEGAVVELAAAASPIAATHAGTTALAAMPAEPGAGAPARTIVVLGAAGWESKFVAAALEERGWRVALRLPVAPGIVVTQAADALRLDTTRVAAVVALDSTAASSAASLARYVRDGGGLVLAPDAALALPALAAGRPGALVRGTNTFAAATAPVRRATLDYRPLTALRGDATVIARRGTTAVGAARRIAAGRVVQIGEIETWRWRMAGDDEAPDLHRAWWAQAVAAVAYAGAPDPDASATEAAPRAALVAALGPASPAPPSDAPDGPPHDPARDPRVYAAAALLLLAEWASRRLRGAA